MKEWAKILITRPVVLCHGLKTFSGPVIFSHFFSLVFSCNQLGVLRGSWSFFYIFRATILLKRLINLGEERKLLEGKFDYKSNWKCSSIVQIHWQQMTRLRRSITPTSGNRGKRGRPNKRMFKGKKSLVNRRRLEARLS